MKQKGIIILLLILSISAFSDNLTLEKAVEIGLENNIDMAKGKIELENTNLDVLKSKNQFFPTPSLSSSINKNGEEISQTKYENNISIRQSIYSGGSNVKSYEKSRVQNQIDLKSQEILKKDIIYKIRLEYLKALQNKSNLEIYEKAYEDLENQYKNDGLLYQEKLISKSEFLKLESSMLNAKANWVKGKQEYEVSLRKFKNTVGLENDKEIELVIPEIKELNEKKLEKKRNILEGNLNIEELELENELASLNSELAKSDFYPEIDLSLSTHSSGDSVGDSLNDWEWSLGINLSYDLYDWGTKKATLVQSENTEKIKKLNKKDEEITLKNNIDEKYYELENYNILLEAMQKSVESLEEVLKIDKIKYENRYISTTDFLKSKNQLTTEKIEFMNLKMNYYMTYYEYKNLIE